MSAPLLEINAVTHAFRSGQSPLDLPLKALDGVSLTIQPGEVLALVGESGSGKSTLAAVASGQIRPTLGDARIRQKSVANLAPKQRARLVQMVPQHPGSALDPRWRIGALMGEVLRLHPDLKDRSINTAMAQVDLPVDLLSRRPRSLSGGQAQRACIARALLLEPDLLICDEAVASLDPPVRAEILSLLVNLSQQHAMAMLFITHNLSELSGFADRIAVLYLGTLVEITDRLDRAYHPYTKALYALTKPQVSGSRRVRLSGEPPSIAKRPNGCVFKSRCPRATQLCLTPPPVQSVTNGMVRCHHIDEAAL